MKKYENEAGRRQAGVFFHCIPYMGWLVDEQILFTFIPALVAILVGQIQYTEIPLGASLFFDDCWNRMEKCNCHAQKTDWIRHKLSLVCLA